MKKIFLLITILAIGVLSCGNNDNENSATVPENNTQNVQNVEQPQQTENKFNLNFSLNFSIISSAEGILPPIRP